MDSYVGNLGVLDIEECWRLLDMHEPRIGRIGFDVANIDVCEQEPLVEYEVLRRLTHVVADCVSDLQTPVATEDTKKDG